MIILKSDVSKKGLGSKMNRMLNGTHRHTLETLHIQFRTTAIKLVSCLQLVKHATSVKSKKRDMPVLLRMHHFKYEWVH